MAAVSTPYGDAPQPPGGHGYGQGSGYPGHPPPGQGHGGTYGPSGYGAAPGYVSSPSGRPLAGRGERLAAALLDGLGSSLLMVPVVVLLVALLVTAGSGVDGDGELGTGAGLAVLAGLGLLVGGLLAVTAAWFVWWPVRTNGQTPAKQLLGLRAVKQDGTPFTWSTAIVRYLVYGVLGWISAVFCLVDDRRRCLHDMAAGTVVVPA